MLNLSNSQNFFLLYLKVLIGYILAALIIVGFLSLVINLIYGSSINLMTGLFKSWTGTLTIFAISSFFSTLEIKLIRLGWFFYGLLLFTRLYFLFKPAAALSFLPSDVIGIWNAVLIIHPFVHHFFAGRIIEYCLMTKDQREYIDDLRFMGYMSQYEGLSSEAKDELIKYGIFNASEYAEYKTNPLDFK
jgi:hypothetical protein